LLSAKLELGKPSQPLKVETDRVLLKIKYSMRVVGVHVLLGGWTQEGWHGGMLRVPGLV
jgi:hypothetical protein